MIKITWTIGIGKDKDGKPIQEADRVLFINLGCRRIARAFGGFTASAVGVGGWFNPKGVYTEEPSFSVYTITDKLDSRTLSEDIAVYFRDSFNQECVQLTREVIQVKYV